MRPWLRFLASIAFLFVPLSAHAGVDPDDPNFIFIMFDDLGYTGLSSFHDHHFAVGESDDTRIHTPAFDQLAENGIMFTQYYASAPICSPTRISVLSGNAPGTYGIRTIVNKTDPQKGVFADAATLPALLAAKGYRTAHIGKWHAGAQPYGEFTPTDPRYGYERTAIIGEPPAGVPRYHADLVINGQGCTGEPHCEGGPENHLTERLIQQAIGFVESMEDGDRFFINLWLLSPHRPLCALPQDAGTPSTEFGWHQGLIENADTQVADLVQALENKIIDGEKALRNTVIVVTSDNGGYTMLKDFPGECGTPVCCEPECPGVTCPTPAYLTNGRFTKGKMETLEGGIRVPMIVHFPRETSSTEGTINDSVVSTIDLFPTFASLAGIEPTSFSTQGTSFTDLITTVTTRPQPDALVWEHKSHIHEENITYAIRDVDGFKLVEHGRVPFGRKVRLYDMNADPEEETDLFDENDPNDPLATKVDDLRDQYRRWRQETGRIEVAGYTEVGGISTATDQAGRLEVTASGGGHLIATDDSRVDLNLDDFTFSIWFRPTKKTTEEDNAPNVIAAKDDSWELRLETDNTVSLTVFGKPCAPTDTGCLEEQTVTTSVAVVKDNWYHVAFTTFHNFVATTPAEVVLYLFGIDDNAHVFKITDVDWDAGPGDDMGVRAFASSMNPVTISANGSGGTPYFGKLFNPRFFHTVLLQTPDRPEIQSLAESDQVSELGPCPLHKNHLKYMGPKPVGGVWGQDWTQRVVQLNAPQCCNPSIQCNWAGACLGQDKIGVDNANGLGTACVVSSNSQGSPLTGPALYVCSAASVDQILQHDGNDAFRCEATVDSMGVTHYDFVDLTP